MLLNSSIATLIHLMSYSGPMEEEKQVRELKDGQYLSNESKLHNTVVLNNAVFCMIIQNPKREGP